MHFNIYNKNTWSWSCWVFAVEGQVNLPPLEKKMLPHNPPHPQWLFHQWIPDIDLGILRPPVAISVMEKIRISFSWQHTWIIFLLMRSADLLWQRCYAWNSPDLLHKTFCWWTVHLFCGRQQWFASTSKKKSWKLLLYESAVCLKWCVYMLNELSLIDYHVLNGGVGIALFTGHVHWPSVKKKLSR